jgi:hypothetical protein
VTEGQIYHRKQGTNLEDVETARKQIDSQELWGGPARNFLQSNIPKVKAYLRQLPPDNTGIEFETAVEPDRNTPPGVVYWSGDREGVRNEGGYAKIKVQILFCNQFEEIYDRR